MLRKNRKKLISLLMLVFFTVLVVRVNRVTKTELVSRNGQTFEKAVVEEILTDNLQADGSRVGQQTVTVKMLTGVRKGETLEVTSSSGYLFGAGCTPGMHVIVMQSVAGETTIASVYTQGRGMGDSHFCSAVPASALCDRRKAGGKRKPWTCLY